MSMGQQLVVREVLDFDGTVWTARATGSTPLAQDLDDLDLVFFVLRTLARYLHALSTDVEINID